MSPTGSPHPPLAERRWLRLSLRGLMVLVLILGGVAGWVANTIRTQRQAIAAVRAVGGTIVLDYQREQIGTNPAGRPLYRKEPAAPACLRRWLGDELFQHVRSVSLLEPTTTPAILDSVAQFDRLEDLTIGAAYVGNNYGRLRGLSQLRFVLLGGPGTTDAMLAELGQIRTLTRVQIGRYLSAMRLDTSKLDSAVTDAGLSHLAALEKLEQFTIESCPQVTDAATARLVTHWPHLISLSLNTGLATVTQTLPAVVRHHPDLQFLELNRSGTTDADLAALAGLTKLIGLHLSGTRITGVGLVHLRALRSLNTLMASTPNLTDEGLQAISELTSIQQLWLNTSQVTDAGLIHLLPLTKLKQLNVGRTRINDAGTVTLARITSLERLMLSYSPQITDACLPPLQKLPNLQTLEVSQTQVTPAGIATLRQAMPKLRRILNQPAPRPSKPPSSAPTETNP